MARRNRRRLVRHKSPSPWVILLQIVVLVGALLAVVAVADRIGNGTGAIFETLTSEDIDVKNDAATESGDVPILSGAQTDDETPDDSDRSDSLDVEVQGDAIPDRLVPENQGVPVVPEDSE